MNDFDEYIPLVKTGLHYGDAKVEAEQIVVSCMERVDIDTNVIRPANVTGSGSVWVREILDEMSGRLLPLIDGGRWSSSMVYVENLVDWLLIAMDDDVSRGRTYNLRDDYNVT